MMLPAYLERDLPRIAFRKRVLTYVADFQAEHGRSPAHKEIAAGVGVKTEPAVWRALKILEAEGRIERHRTQIRIIM